MLHLTNSGIEEVKQCKAEVIHEDHVQGAYNVAFTGRHHLDDPLRTLVEMDNILLGIALSTSSKEGMRVGEANVLLVKRQRAIAKGCGASFL